MFDPFSGFSGRLLGACALGKHYIGQDLNEKHVNESNDIINFLNLSDLATVVQKDILTSSKERYECLFTCPPYEGKEHWNLTDIEKPCDEWINICLDKFECNKYLFVVDETIKYKNYIVDTITNKSHFGSNNEYVVLIAR